MPECIFPSGMKSAKITARPCSHIMKGKRQWKRVWRNFGIIWRSIIPNRKEAMQMKKPGNKAISQTSLISRQFYPRQFRVQASLSQGHVYRLDGHCYLTLQVCRQLTLSISFRTVSSLSLRSPAICEGVFPSSVQFFIRRSRSSSRPSSRAASRSIRRCSSALYS